MAPEFAASGAVIKRAADEFLPSDCWSAALITARREATNKVIPQWISPSGSAQSELLSATRRKSFISSYSTFHSGFESRSSGNQFGADEGRLAAGFDFTGSFCF